MQTLWRLAVGAGLALGMSGCVLAVPKQIYKIESERLAKKEAWENSLAKMSCDDLNKETAVLVAEKDTLVDYDQRVDYLAETMVAKECPTPG